MRILLIIYGNGSYTNWFPQGMAYISSAIRKDGHEVVIYNQDINHNEDSEITKYLNKNCFDMVGIGIIAGYYQYKKLLSISDAINKSKNRSHFKYCLGGHGPSPEPEFFIKKTNADFIVIGEGEKTIVEVLKNNFNYKDINGIAYRDGDKVIINKERELIQDVDSIEWPDYELFPIEIYRMLRMPNCKNEDLVMPLVSGKGCPFKCNFCYRLDKGFRPRSNSSIVEEIKFLKERYKITYILFSDELLMSSKDRTKSLCEDFLSDNLDIKWSCNGRLNYASKDVLELMKRAGCVFINYGIESVDNAVLKNMKKSLNYDQIVRGVKNTLEAGISPGLNFIWGNIGDTEKTLQDSVDFLLEYDDYAQMRTIKPVTCYPGSPLYYYAIEKGLLKDCEDFYENKHVNSDLVSVNFTNLSDEDFHKQLLSANSILIKKYFERKIIKTLDETYDLYYNKNVNFRGFR